MRVHVKKRNYRKHVRAQLQAGLANNANGDWIRAEAIQDTKVSARAQSVSARSKP
jgi:hypothetical protein